MKYDGTTVRPMSAANEAKHLKAARIVSDGRINEMVARSFRVMGTDRVYTVTIVSDMKIPNGTGLLPPHSVCSCAWGKSEREGYCAHVLAARAFIEAETPRDPFEGLPR